MKRIDAEKVVGELALLRRIRHRIGAGRRDGVRVGVGDDCAVLRLRPGEELAVTTDLSIAGRHFRLDWHPAEAVGHRTLARGLSDLAAMGARPVAALLSLGLPGELTEARRGGDSRAWIDRFYDGLLALAEIHKTPLAGGDLAQSPVAVADIVLVGAVAKGRALLRSGARPGDVIYVTGSLGGAAAGLAALSKLERKTGPARLLKIPRNASSLLAPHLYPQPRVGVGLYLQRRGLATAALDLSDGLSTDLRHLCEESGLGAVIEAECLPVHPAATLDQALHGGEDYELLFTARPGTRIPRQIAGVPTTRIGTITKALRGDLRVEMGRVEMSVGGVVHALASRGWEHFS